MMRAIVFLSVLAAVATGCSDDDPVVQSCEDQSCHGVSGTNTGIELAHPASAKLTCTDCHGGDGSVVDKDLAHVQPTAQFIIDRNGYIKNLSVNELDMVNPAYLQFLNPGDYRVAEKGCGSQSPKNDGSGCHTQLVYNAQRSTMATFTGHFNVPRFQAGMQDRPAVLGSRALSDPQRPNPAPPGSVASIAQAIPPGATAPRDDIHTAMDNYLPKNCTHCHQWSYGRNDARGNFRSSGCTACHMYYNNDGISLSKDPSAPQEIPPHPQEHTLTSAINETQCEHCHYQGARIGLLYRGVIEWGVSEDPPFPNIGESLHNHPPEFYLQASADSNHPADLHYDAGMACADCHVGRDVHGDGRIYSTSKFQVAVRCENCHGLFCSEAALNSIQRAWFESPGVKTEKDIDTGHTSTGRYFNERGQITCPSCGTWMDDVTVEDQTHIWFEHCSNCGGAFFDAGELTDLRYKTLADTVRDFVSPKRD